MEEVLAEELGSTFNAEDRQAWKHGLSALVAGISKTLKYNSFKMLILWILK